MQALMEFEENNKSVGLVLRVRQTALRSLWPTLNLLKYMKEAQKVVRSNGINSTLLSNVLIDREP